MGTSISHFFVSVEKMVMWAASTAIVCCMVITLTLALILGIGLGYHYNLVDSSSLPMSPGYYNQTTFLPIYERPKNFTVSPNSSTEPAPGNLPLYFRKLYSTRPSLSKMSPLWSNNVVQQYSPYYISKKISSEEPIRETEDNYRTISKTKSPIIKTTEDYTTTSTTESISVSTTDVRIRTTDYDPEKLLISWPKIVMLTNTYLPTVTISTESYDELPSITDSQSESSDKFELPNNTDGSQSESSNMDSQSDQLNEKFNDKINAEDKLDVDTTKLIEDIKSEIDFDLTTEKPAPRIVIPINGLDLIRLISKLKLGNRNYTLRVLDT